MRTFCISIFLFFSAASGASTVTIDFEENPAEINGTVLSKGYEVYGESWDTYGWDYGGISTGPNGTLTFGAGTGGDICNSGGCNGIYLDIKKEDGGFFALYSYDLFESGVLFGVNVTGITADGQTVGLSTPLGTGDWLNLQRVEFYADNYNGGYAPAIEVELDNIVVGAAVPIPAAVWLFGSALAGLGWLRRKQTI